MSAFATVRANMIHAGMVDPDTGRLTAAGMAYADCIIAELKTAPPPADGARSHRGARIPCVKWNTKRRKQ